MASNGEACNIIPQAVNNDGQEINSPLYSDLYAVVKGDRNRAVSLYQKATSDEIRERIESLPSELVSYYPGTTTPTLATVLNVSDMDGLISEDELLEWLNDTVDVEVNTMADLQKVVDFNEGEWGTRFRVAWNVNQTSIARHLETPDPSIKYSKFALQLYKDLVPLMEALNISEKDFNDIANNKKLVMPRPMYDRVEDFADLLLNIANFAKGKPTQLTCFSRPNTMMATILMKYLKNSDNLIRLLNDLRKDDYYKSRADTDPELQNLSDEEMLMAVATRIIANTINKDTRGVKASSVNRSIRLVEEFKTKIGTNSRLLPKNIINVVRTANENTSVINENFISAHPAFIGESLTSGEIVKMQEAFEQLYKLTLTYLSLTQHSYRENKENTTDLDATQFLWYNNMDEFKGARVQTNKNALDTRLRQTILNIQSSAEACKQLVEALSFDSNTQEALLSNNLLCGKLRHAMQTIEYLERMLDELNKIMSYQRDNNIASTVFTRDIRNIIQQTNSIIKEQKQLILETTKKAVINELEATFPFRTFTLPSGERVSVREWVEGENFDILASEKLLSSVEECSNPILSLLDAYKKVAVQYGREEYQRTRDEVRDAARGLKSKDTSWMFTTIKRVNRATLEQYLKSNPVDADEEFIQTLQEFLKTKKYRRSFKLSELNALYADRAEGAGIPESFREAVKNSVVESPSGKYIMDYDYDTFAAQYNKFCYDTKTNPLYQNLSAEEKQRRNAEEFERLTEVREDLGGGRYPRRDLFSNKEFEKLSDEQKHYWSVFMKNKGILINYFPERHYGIDDAIYIRKTNRDMLLQGIKTGGVMGFFKALKKNLISAFTENSRDVDVSGGDDVRYVETDFSGNIIYSLPIFYTTLHESETMDDISLDTTTAFEEYSKAMNNAAALRNVINILNCATDVIQNAKYKDRSVLSKPKKVFRRVGKHRDVETYTKPPEELNSLSMYKHWLKTQVYGHRTQDVKKGWRLAGNLYMKWVSFGTLALNVASGFANIIQGLNQVVPTAIGGYFFNLKDLAKAAWTYDKYMFPIQKDSGILELGGTVQNNKFNLFSRKFNIMQDYGEEVTHFDETRAERLINGNILYVFLHAGEHYLQHRGALAMLFNDKNKVVTEDGRSITAFDAYDKVSLDNGGSKLVLQTGLTTTLNGGRSLRIITNEEMAQRAKEAGKNVMDKSLIQEGEISESEWVSLLSQKMAALNHYLHGIYNTEDQNRAQYYVLGRMAMMYRKYLIPAINRRFGINTYIAALDSDVEGFYNTLGKFHWRLTKELLTDSHKDYEDLNPDLKSIAEDYLRDQGYDTHEKRVQYWSTLDKRTRRNILFGKKTAWGATFGDLTEMQKGNMRSAWGEIGIFFSLVIANLILDYDDDDDDEVTMAALKYYMRRAQTEVSALTPVSLILAPFAFFDKQDYPELHALGMQNMATDMQQLLNQPIVGTSHIKDISELAGVVKPENWQKDAEYDEDKFPNEAMRLLAKQMTPYRNWYFWTSEYYHRKEAWYKQ